jgi:hypothetical protein
MKNLTMLTESPSKKPPDNVTWTGWKFRLQKKVVHTSRRLSIASTMDEENGHASTASNDEGEAPFVSSTEFS